MRVGLIVFATNKYNRFVPALYQSMQQYFLNEAEIERTMFLFTDNPSLAGPLMICQEHEAWPAMTLKRYEIVAQHRLLFKRMDYLFMCDADMLFVDRVGREILGDRVATIHFGFWNAPRECFTYENNPLSTAYISPTEGFVYYAGGFNGGTTETFLAMAKVLAANINADLQKGYIAIWHDESHLNRFYLDHKPTLALSPAYCYQEGEWFLGKLPFPKKLISLCKDAGEYQI